MITQPELWCCFRTLQTWKSWVTLTWPVKPAGIVVFITSAISINNWSFSTRITWERTVSNITSPPWERVAVWTLSLEVVVVLVEQTQLRWSSRVDGDGTSPSYKQLILVKFLWVNSHYCRHVRQACQTLGLFNLAAWVLPLQVEESAWVLKYSVLIYPTV